MENNGNELELISAQDAHELTFDYMVDTCHDELIEIMQEIKNACKNHKHEVDLTVRHYAIVPVLLQLNYDVDIVEHGENARIHVSW
jgi:hypothetical protein